MGERRTGADAAAPAARTSPADLGRLGAEYGLGEYERTQFEREYPPYRGIGLLIEKRMPVRVTGQS